MNDDEEQRLRVAIVVMSEYPSVGGYENLVRDLTEELDRRAEVHVICSGVDPRLPVPGNVQVHAIQRWTNAGGIGLFVDAFLNMIRMAKFLRRHKMDVINVHPSFPEGLSCLIPARLVRVPLVATSHGEDIQLDKESGYGIRQNPIVASLLKWVLKNSDAHTLVSKSMFDDALAAGSTPDKITVIHNGLDFSKRRCSGNLSRFNIEEDDTIILYLGRLHPKKCPEDLIRAYRIIKNERPDCTLIMGGTGPQAEYLKNLSSELGLDVVMPGFVNDEEKWALIRRADLFVLPSAVEGLPITLIEAMACSCPAVTTDVGPFPEVVTDGATGLLVPLHKPDELARAILKLCNNPALRETMGRNARDDSLNRFSISRCADKYMRLYQEVIR